MTRDAEIARIAAAMNGRIEPRDVQLGHDLMKPAAALYDAGLRTATPADSPPLRDPRDSRVDWDAVERLVDEAVRRGDISAGRAAEILGLRLRTWLDRAVEFRDEIDR
jgi:hypothetical protein